MSDTPRTDGLLDWVKLPEDIATHARNLETLARELERELATARYDTAVKCADWVEQEAEGVRDGREYEWSRLISRNLRAYAATLKDKP